MSTYLVIKNGTDTKSYPCKTSAEKPYIKVSTYGYVPLTTQTNTKTGLRVKANGVVHQVKAGVTVTSTGWYGFSVISSLYKDVAVTNSASSWNASTLYSTVYSLKATSSSTISKPRTFYNTTSIWNRIPESFSSEYRIVGKVCDNLSINTAYLNAQTFSEKASNIHFWLRHQTLSTSIRDATTGVTTTKKITHNFLIKSSEDNLSFNLSLIGKTFEGLTFASNVSTITFTTWKTSTTGNTKSRMTTRSGSSYTANRSGSVSFYDVTFQYTSSSESVNMYFDRSFTYTTEVDE